MKSLLLAIVAVFAVAPTLAPATAKAETIFGLTANDQLFSFDSALPGLTSPRVPITGLPPNEFLLAIDFRPVATNSPSAASNGVLYALGATHHLYTINTANAVATVVPGAPFAMGGSAFGIDFNPVPDRLRVVNDVDENFRLDPNTATVSGFDNPLLFTAGDPNVGVNPNVVAAALQQFWRRDTNHALWNRLRARRARAARRSGRRSLSQHRRTFHHRPTRVRHHQ
jgi:hypothetical protein